MHRKKEKLRQLPRYTWEHVGETSGLFFFILVRHFPWWEPCDFCVTDIVILSSHPHWTSFVGLQIEITVLFIWSWGFGLKNTLREQGAPLSVLLSAVRWSFPQLSFIHLHRIWICDEVTLKENTPHMETTALWAWRDADEYANRDYFGK